MSFGPLTDPVVRVAHAALDGVSTRQRVVADNLANAATPGYRAREVSFEDQLAAAIADGEDPESVAFTTGYADSPLKADGNSVDVTEQAMMLDQTQLQYESLVGIVNFRHNVIRAGLAR